MNFLPLPKKSASDSVGSQPLVLVYSREADTRFLFKTLLEMWNYRVAEAASFEDSIFAGEDVKPDLVLMDTTITFDENLLLMRRLREREAFSRTPFILLSGHSQAQFRQKAIALGANDFLVKPVDFDSLERSLQKNIKTGFQPNA